MKDLVVTEKKKKLVSNMRTKLNFLHKDLDKLESMEDEVEEKP